MFIAEAALYGDLVPVLRARLKRGRYPSSAPMTPTWRAISSRSAPGWWMTTGRSISKRVGGERAKAGRLIQFRCSLACAVPPLSRLRPE